MARTVAHDGPSPPPSSPSSPRLGAVIGMACLESLLEGCVGVSGTSASLFEADGMLATESRSGAYCRFLDQASLALCEEPSWCQAQNDPRWLCHNDCRARAARAALATRQPVDLAPCPGGLLLHATPLILGEEILGVLCLAQGRPPTDPSERHAIAQRYHVDPAVLDQVITQQNAETSLDLVAETRTQARLLAMMVVELYSAHQRREKVERDEALFRLLVENQSLLIVKVDHQGRLLYVNPTYCQTFGHPPEALLGRPFLPLVHEDDQAATLAAMADLEHPPHQAYMEQRALTVSGWRWFGWQDTGVVDETGALVAIIGVGRDIDAKKRAEEAHAKSERRFRRLFDQATWGLLVHDLEGRFLDVNPRACAKLGYSRDELLRLSVWDVDPTVGGLPNPAEFWRTLRTPEEQTFESQHRRRDGTLFPVTLSLSVIEENDGPAILVMAQDISERKQNEAQRLRMLEALTRSNADLERFAYMVSHDLREPVRTIGAYAQLLYRRYQGRLDPEADTFLGFMTEGVRRLDTLIHSSLELSRVFGAPPTLIDIDLDTVVEGALGNLSAVIADTKAQVSVAPLPRVRGDFVQLVSLFQNLMGNALKYHKPDQPPVLRITAQPLAKGWRILVTDNGVGIAPEDREVVFQVFKRLESARIRPGQGIGLAVVRRIVETHGWDIGLESELGRGTTVMLFLPARPE